MEKAKHKCRKVSSSYKKKQGKLIIRSHKKWQENNLFTLVCENLGVFKLAKVIKTNQGIIGKNCIRNDDGVLAVSDKHKITCKS